MTPDPSQELGKWLSAALDDPDVCAEMKADINAWFEAGQPVLTLGEAQIEAMARAYYNARYRLPDGHMLVMEFDLRGQSYVDADIAAMRAAIAEVREMFA